MRILHILNHTGRLNGNVHAAVDLACAQVQLGHEVCVASSGGDFDELFHANKVETIFVEHHRSPLKLLRSGFALHRHLRKLKPDVVHAHMMTSAVLAWPLCKIAGIPLITTVHNEFEKSAILMGLGRRVIAVSDSVGKSMVRRGISRSRIRVVLNGTIGSARSQNRDQAAISLDSPSVLYVGGLHPRKGLPDLLEAYQIAREAVPKGKIYVMGAGPYEAEYRNMAAGMSCASSIEFLGMKADPYQWMAAADIFVLPSHADPAPLVISEAREARCAVIGTRVDGIPELLAHGAAGILVPSRNPQALSQELVSLLQNPAKIEEWKEKSQIGIERLTIARAAIEVLAIYRSVIKNPK